MNLKILSDASLLSATDALVKSERELLAKVLHHLREIDRRRLFSALGFSSLFAYAVGRLGYAEDQAHRRISAMRLLRELPELEAKVESGALNLTQLGMAKAAFGRKAFAREEKLELLAQVEGKSTREAEAMMMDIAPLPAKPEKVRAESSTSVRVEFSAPNSLVEKIERLKGQLAHSHPGLSTAELFEMLCDQALISKEPAAPRVKSKAHMQRQVWAAARRRCENCQSTYALQRDHRIPRALGGPDTRENSRLLCRHCNQRAAIEAFGADKMESYLTSPAIRPSVRPKHGS